MGETEEPSMEEIGLKPEGDLQSIPEAAETKPAGSLIEQFIARGETGGALYEIVNNNRDRDGIEEFFKDYVAYLKQKVDDAEEAALRNIGYAFGEVISGALPGTEEYKQKMEIINSWRDVIPGLKLGKKK